MPTAAEIAVVRTAFTNAKARCSGSQMFNLANAYLAKLNTHTDTAVSKGLAFINAIKNTDTSKNYGAFDTNAFKSDCEAKKFDSMASTEIDAASKNWEAQREYDDYYTDHAFSGGYIPHFNNHHKHPLHHRDSYDYLHGFDQYQPVHYIAAYPGDNSNVATDSSAYFMAFAASFMAIAFVCMFCLIVNVIAFAGGYTSGKSARNNGRNSGKWKEDYRQVFHISDLRLFCFVNK